MNKKQVQQYFSMSFAAGATWLWALAYRSAPKVHHCDLDMPEESRVLSGVAAYNDREALVVPRSMDSDVYNRLSEQCAGRMSDIWLPRNLERRVKAATHRANCELLVAGHEGNMEFEHILIDAANRGVELIEQEDGVRYDELTGCAIDSLEGE